MSTARKRRAKEGWTTGGQQASGQRETGLQGQGVRREEVEVVLCLLLR